MTKPDSPYMVLSVDRALEILLLLGQCPHDMGVTELAKIIGVQKSTTHSLLQTLMYRGFVRQTDTGRYTLGVQLLQLGRNCAERLDISQVARHALVELAEETQEVAMLAILSRDELVIIEKVEPQRPFLMIPKFDFSIALHSTAMGKVLLANSPEEMIERVIEKGLCRYTSYTLTNKDSLQKELGKIRLQEYAIGCNETIEGITCIAVPIYDVYSKVVAALSISSATSILTEERRMLIIDILKQKGKQISRRLGYLINKGGNDSAQTSV